MPEHAMPYSFVPREKLLAMRTDDPDNSPIPRMQELRDSGSLEKRLVDLGEAFQGKGCALDTLFISHRWEEPTNPDPGCTQLVAIQAFLEEHPEIGWVWYDYMCLPQKERDGKDERTEEERDEFDAQLPTVGNLYLSMRVLILIDLQYLGRFWPQYESWW